MAIIVTGQDVAAPQRTLRNAMRPLHGLAALTIANYRLFADWRERRTQAHQLASLPMDMRKDFGWPGPDRH